MHVQWFPSKIIFNFCKRERTFSVFGEFVYFWTFSENSEISVFGNFGFFLTFTGTVSLLFSFRWQPIK